MATVSELMDEAGPDSVELNNYRVLVEDEAGHFFEFDHARWVHQDRVVVLVLGNENREHRE